MVFERCSINGVRVFRVEIFRAFKIQMLLQRADRRFTRIFGCSRIALNLDHCTIRVNIISVNTCNSEKSNKGDSISRKYY